MAKLFHLNCPEFRSPIYINFFFFTFVKVRQQSLSLTVMKKKRGLYFSPAGGAVQPDEEIA